MPQTKTKKKKITLMIECELTLNGEYWEIQLPNFKDKIVIENPYK